MNTQSQEQIDETSAAVAHLIKVTSDELEAQGKPGLDILPDESGPLSPDVYGVVASMKRAALKIHSITGEIRWLHAAKLLQAQLDAGCTTGE